MDSNDRVPPARIMLRWRLFVDCNLHLQQIYDINNRLVFRNALQTSEMDAETPIATWSERNKASPIGPSSDHGDWDIRGGQAHILKPAHTHVLWPHHLKQTTLIIQWSKLN